jgi:hypothetical protein
MARIGQLTYVRPQFCLTLHNILTQPAFLQNKLLLGRRQDRVDIFLIVPWVLSYLQVALWSAEVSSGNLSDKLRDFQLPIWLISSTQFTLPM